MLTLFKKIHQSPKYTKRFAPKLNNDFHDKITHNFNADIQHNFTRENFICDIAETHEDNLQHFYQQTFQNQKKFGNDCCNHLLNGKKAVWAIAPTQSGKTGSMISLAFHASLHNFKTQHIFVFTPHSSKEWVLQTRDRFPTEFKDRILHRNKLDSLIQAVIDIPKTHNIIIIIDETHLAAKINQSLHKLYQQLGCYLPDKPKHIHFVHFTATPIHLTEQFSKFWGNLGVVQHMLVPNSYLSWELLCQQNRVFQAKDLCGYDKKNKSFDKHVFDNIRELTPFLKQPAFHIIRTPRGYLHDIVIQNFKHVFNDKNFVFISEPSLKQDFTLLLLQKPNTHTFIFIKDKLRCAKTLHHQFLGILYDRHVMKPLKHVVLQSLAGRITGYHHNNHVVVFTHTTLFYIKFKSFLQ